jgi:hypothetical protein
MTELERTELRDGEFVCDVCRAFRVDNDAMFNFWKNKVRPFSWLLDRRSLA